MPEKLKIPRPAMTFAEGEVTLADSIENKPRQFHIDAYSGKIIKDHWWWGNFAIDLDGLKPAKKKMPVLREHMRDRIVGVGNTSVDETGMHVEGAFSKNTPDALEVLALADEGFPWEASIHAVPEKIEYIDAGSEAEVNGQKLKGPGTIFRKTIARETSFVTLGADKHTKAVSLSDADEYDVEITGDSKGKEVSQMPMPKEEKKEETKTQEYAPKDLVVSVSLADLREARPDLVTAFEAESKTKSDDAVAAALAAEKQRIAGIIGDTHPGMEKLALKHIAEGTSVENTKSAMLKAYSEAAPKSLGPNSELVLTVEETAGAELSVEDQAKKDWTEKKAIRDEFLSEASYVAYMKNKSAGRIKILGKKTE